MHSRPVCLVICVFASLLAFSRSSLADQLILSSEDPLAPILHVQPVPLSPAGGLGQTFTLSRSFHVNGLEVNASGTGQFVWQIANHTGPGTTTQNVLAQGIESYPSAQQNLLLQTNIDLNAGTYYFLLSYQNTQDFSEIGYFELGCMCNPTANGEFDFAYLFGANPGFAPAAGFFYGSGNAPLMLNLYGEQNPIAPVPEPASILLLLVGSVPALLLKKPRALGDNN